MTKWTIPDDLVARLRGPTNHPGLKPLHESAADRIETLEAALRAIITEAPTLNYAQGIARDALHGGDK